MFKAQRRLTVKASPTLRQHRGPKRFSETSKVPMLVLRFSIRPSCAPAKSDRPFLDKSKHVILEDDHKAFASARQTIESHSMRHASRVWLFFIVFNQAFASSES